MDRDALCPGNLFLFVHPNGLEMSKIMKHLKDTQRDFTEFAITNLLGRVFYCDGDASYYVCLLGRNQRCDGSPVTKYELKDLAAQVRASREVVPAFMREDEDVDPFSHEEDSQGRSTKVRKPAGPHWIRWVVTQPFYHKYMKTRIGERRLVGISMSPVYNPGPNEAYLVAYAPPVYLPSITRLTSMEDYNTYVHNVSQLKIPGTGIGAIRWFLSFLFWVRFDGDIASFITFLVLCVSSLHPCGWAPGKIFIFSGDQNCGKSEMLIWLSSLMNLINLNDNISLDGLIRQFNSSTCKPRMLCHEAGTKWITKLNSGTIRTLVTDVKSKKEFERKFGAQIDMYGCPLIVIAADRSGEGTSFEQRERRHAHIAFAKDPKEPADFRPFHLAVQLFSRLFSQANESLNQFREDFRKKFLDFIAIYFDLICPNGVKVPNLFQRKDFFNDRAEEVETGAASQTIGPPSKRARTSAAPITATFADAVNSLAHHLAMTGSCFPVEHPNVFALLFKQSQLFVFSEADTEDAKSNLIRKLLQATWHKDCSVYSLDGTTAWDDTLSQLYEQWKVEDESDGFEQSVEAKAFRDQIAFQRMLAKFKQCLMIKAMLAMDDRYTAWPRLLNPSTALWLIGVWVNFKANGNRLVPMMNAWGGGEGVGLDVEKLGSVARLLAKRLSGRPGFQGQKETILTAQQISNVLGTNIASFIGKTTLPLKAIALPWGPFCVLKNLIAEVSPNFRPSEDQLEQMVKKAGGEICIMDQDRQAYDSLVSATKTRLMEQLGKYLSDPEAISKSSEEERIFFVLYSDIFNEGPMGLLRKQDFYTTLGSIDEHVRPVNATIGFRPSTFALYRDPSSLGETVVGQRAVHCKTMLFTLGDSSEVETQLAEVEQEKKKQQEWSDKPQGIQMSPIIASDSPIDLSSDAGLSFEALEDSSQDLLS